LKSPQHLSRAISELPYEARHVIASIVAYRCGPSNLRGDPHWQKIWEMARDHEPIYDWPSGEYVRSCLLSFGIRRQKVDSIMSTYDGYGDVQTASPSASWNFRDVVLSRGKNAPQD